MINGHLSPGHDSGKYCMFLAILTLITALCISAVAIYYSIAGLVAIFAAAAIPIMVMGGVLEVGKLVTAVWLHRYWKQAAWWLKTYLSIAVVLLMVITSMGIFGFLSKAHIEQTSASNESIEQIARIEKDLARYDSIIVRAEAKITKTENAGANQNDTIQDQIDREQKRIDTAYERIKPLVAEQQEVIKQELLRKDKKVEPYLAQVESIDADLATLTNLLNRRDTESIKRLQSIVGTRVDGNYGSNTAGQVEAYREGLVAKRDSILQTIRTLEAKESPLIVAANNEIKRLRDIAEKEIADSNKLINKLRQDIGSVTPDNNTEFIEAELLKIKNANAEIDSLTEQKYSLEAEYRKLEAEVGPIKYIAELIYGEDVNRDLLEEAVRWVIILIIFVFDPLAVLLLIASQYTLEFRKPKSPNDQWRKYEQARAQKIVDNEKNTQEQEEVETDDLLEKVSGSPTSDMFDKTDWNKNALEYGEEKDPNQLEFDFEKKEADTTEEWQELYEDKEVDQEPKLVPAEPEQLEKKESSSEEYRLTAEDIEALELLDDWKEAKKAWKLDNPGENIATYKQWYLDKKIDSFPWESYLPAETLDSKKKKGYLTKVENQQLRFKAEE
tara:strand:+ start:14643 stop:16481 length:1839 start_codon:yes stop_codon:yes gene_type:complete